MMNMTHKSKPKMPEREFSDEVIAQFWDTHDIVDYWDELEVAKDVKFIKPKKELVSIRLEPIYLRQLKVIAKKMGIAYSSLARIWLVDRLRHLPMKARGS